MAQSAFNGSMLANLMAKKTLGMSASPTPTTTQPITTGSMPSIKKKTDPSIYAPPSVTGMSASAAASPIIGPPAPTTGSMPQVAGYKGGADYNNLDMTGKQAMQDNSARIKTDDAYRQSEITRALGVKQGLSAQGQSTADQDKYLAMLGYTAPSTGMSASAASTGSTGSMPSYGTSQGDAVTNVRNSQDLQQLATDETAQERAALLNAINTQMGDLRNNAQYANQLVSDQRRLEDQALLRNKNPFSGGTDYQLGMVQRGRSIDDTSRAAGLENQLNSLSTEIANFDKLTPERQRSIYNELLGLERDFGLNVGNMTGTYGNQRTLAGNAQDWGQQMDIANLTGNIANLGNAAGAYGGTNALGGANGLGLQTLAGLAGTRTLDGQRMDLDNRKFNVDTALQYGDRTGKVLSPQQDINGLFRQIETGKTSAGTALQDSIIGRQQNVNEAESQSRLTTEQQSRDISTRESAMQEWQTNGFATPNVAAILGVPQGTPTSDQSYRDSGLALDQDKFTYSQMYDTANLQNKQNQQQQQTISTAAAAQLLMKKGTDANGKPAFVPYTDHANREQAFVDLYTNYGVTGADMINALTKAGYTTDEINLLKSEPDYAPIFQ